MKRAVSAAILALSLASPASAQAPRLFDQFLSLCDATSGNADAANAKARADGFVRPPEKYIPATTIPNMRNVKTLWKTIDDGAIVLITGILPFQLLPGIDADACAVIIGPAPANALEPAAAWASVPAIPLGGRSIYFFRETGGQRQAVAGTQLPELQAALAAGEIRGLVTASDNGSATIIMLKPRS